VNLYHWLAFIQALVSAYETSQGKDLRALGYLRVATGLVAGQRATDADLEALAFEYSSKVENQIPTTPEELTELDARLAAQSEAIQAA
jgi:hypothetical protein